MKWLKAGIASEKGKSREDERKIEKWEEMEESHGGAYWFRQVDNEEIVSSLS